MTKETKSLNDLMYLNLNYLGQMTKLTELRLKGLTGIKLTALPSFEKLIHLNRFVSLVITNYIYIIKYLRKEKYYNYCYYFYDYYLVINLY